MARPKKVEEKPIIEEKKVEVAKNATVENKDENNELQKQNAELLELIKSMKEEINTLKAQQISQPQVIVQQSANSDLTRTVKVTSLLGNSYVLSTQPNGRGAIFRFEKYGESKNIKFTEMQSVLQIYGKQFEEGYAVLESKKDYEDLGVGYMYDMVLTKDKMDKLLELKTDEDIEIILNFSDDMLDNVLRLIAYRINNGANYDYNMINRLQKETDLEDYIKLDSYSVKELVRVFF